MTLLSVVGFDAAGVDAEVVIADEAVVADEPEVADEAGVVDDEEDILGMTL